MSKEPFINYFLSSVQIPIRCLRNLAGMMVGMGLRNVVTVGSVRSRLSMYFSNIHHAIPKGNFFRSLKISASSRRI